MCPEDAKPQGSKRPVVEDAAGRRPFMRGIMVHSLMSRGASFDEAYRAAGRVRDRIRGREVVSREELARHVEEIFSDGGLERAPVRLPQPVQVTGQGRGTPFSKGVLAQSLLAAALDPDDAFHAARAIEHELVVRACKAIDRGDLRRLVHDTLARRLGPRAAERYRVWRDFVASERPLLLLLGGAPGVGKTALAQEVGHRLGISRVSSTDHVRQVMRIMLSPELVPAIHCSSYEAHRTLGELPPDTDPWIAGFRAQAGTVCVGIRAILHRAVEENTSLILDGVSVVPGMLDPRAYADQAHVIFLLVASLDPDVFQARFAARARHSRRSPHRYLSNLEPILRIQDHLLELAEQHEVPIVDNVSLDDSVLSVIRYVAESLRRREAPREGATG